jgi:hypothetical protein
MVRFIKNLFKQRQPSLKLEFKNQHVRITSNVGDNPGLFKDLILGLMTGLLDKYIAVEAMNKLKDDKAFCQQLKAISEVTEVEMNREMLEGDDEIPLISPLEVFDNIDQILASQDNSDENDDA